MASMLDASASWKKGNRCSFFGKIYEITVNATMQVSATMIGEFLCRKGSFSIPQRPYCAISGGTTPSALVSQPLVFTSLDLIIIRRDNDQAGSISLTVFRFLAYLLQSPWQFNFSCLLSYFTMLKFLSQLGT